MNRSLKIMMGVMAVALIALPSSLSFGQASRSFEGAVWDVPNAAPFDANCGAKERMWTTNTCDAGGTMSPASCPTSGIGSCNIGGDLGDCSSGASTCKSCRRTAASYFGGKRFGWRTHLDDLVNFCGGAVNPLTNTYVMIDFAEGVGSGNQIGYYYVSGQDVDNVETSQIVKFTCAGADSISCMLPGGNNNSGTTLNNTRVDNDGVTGGNQLINQGGLKPIPSPRVTSAGGGSVTIGWDAASVLLRDSATDPLKAYRVWRAHDSNGNGVCETPNQDVVGSAGDAAAWNALGDVSPPSTSFVDNAPPGGGDCFFYAIQLVYWGPGSGQSGSGPVSSGPGAALGELVSLYRGASSQGISTNPLAVEISNFSAIYVGKNRTRISWSTGVEADVAGFVVERSMVSGGFEAVGSMITATGDNSDYSIMDRISFDPNRRSLSYQLQAVRRDGSREMVGSADVQLPRIPGRRPVIGTGR